MCDYCKEDNEAYLDRIYELHEREERTKEWNMETIQEDDRFTFEEQGHKMKNYYVNDDEFEVSGKWWEENNKKDINSKKNKYNIYFYDENNERISGLINIIENNKKLSDEQMNFLNSDYRLSPLLAEHFERIAYHSEFKNRVKFFAKACSCYRKYSRIRIQEKLFDNLLKKNNYNEKFKRRFIKYSIELSRKGYELISRISYDRVKNNIEDKEIICSYLNTKTASLLDISHNDDDKIKAKKWNDESLSVDKFNYYTWRVKARILSINSNNNTNNNTQKARKAFKYSNELFRDENSE